jgi:methionine-rich copper-binding protein CopC
MNIRACVESNAAATGGPDDSANPDHSEGFRMRLRTYGAALFTLATITAATLVLASPASAHDELVSSSPAIGSILASQPKTVTLTFEEPPASGYTKVTVNDPKGKQLVQKVDSAGSMVTATLDGSGERGAYVISYAIMSDDGHSVSGTIGFTVAATAKPSTSVAASTSDDSGSRNLGWIAAGIAALAVITVIGALRTSRHRRAMSAPR